MKKRLKISSVWNVFAPFIKDMLEDIHGNKCVTCPKESLVGRDRQLGHFMPKKSYPKVRWWIYNLGLQCGKCNGFEGGNQYKFSLWIKKTYGKAVLDSIDLICRQNTNVGQYEYNLIISQIKDYKQKVDNKEMTYKEVFNDIINNKFGIF